MAGTTALSEIRNEAAPHLLLLHLDIIIRDSVIREPLGRPQPHLRGPGLRERSQRQAVLPDRLAAALGAGAGLVRAQIALLRPLLLRLRRLLLLHLPVAFPARCPDNSAPPLPVRVLPARAVLDLDVHEGGARPGNRRSRGR